MMRFEMCLFGLPLLFLFVLTPPAAACPYPCSCTNFRVDCYDKNIKEIPDSFPADVISIDLQYNQIESVGDQFQNLSSLQEVMLRFNRISHLPHGAFSNLPNLRHVNMGSNHIVNLTSDVFQNVPKLVVLDLTDNFLTSLDGAFENLSNLTKVVLTRNNIQQLTEEGLKPLTKLMYLMADENQIDSVSPTAFSSLKELSYVSLHSNPLPDMDNVFSQNDLLSYLDLSNCQLPAVPAGLPWATRHLRLSGNNITMILKDTFMSTRFLGVIRLDGNQITEIQPDAFMPIAHLQEIWLDGNQLTSVPSQIPVTVKTLSIKNNNIKELSHEHFPANSKLSLLSLSGNQITSIAPFTFSRLTSLLQLHLSGNQIAELRNKGLAGMRNLTELDLSRNPISHIDTRFAAGLSKLKTLDLSYVDETEPNLRGNFFRDIPVLRELNLRRSSDLAWNILTSNETLASFYNLHRLDIRDNQFATLSTDLPRFFPNIQSVKLAENAWVCDQQLLWLHDWMKTKREVFEDAGEVVCAAPQYLVGAIIADLPFHAFFHTTTLSTTTTVTEVDIETGSGDEAELTTVEQKWIETTAPEIQPTLTPAETDVTTTFWDSERTTEDSGVTTGGPPTGSGWTTEDGSHQKESTSATVPVTSVSHESFFPWWVKTRTICIRITYCSCFVT